MKDWLKTVNRNQRWCILINADPDAMGSAAALKRIMASRTSADMYRINEITRPDNLAMLRYLHLNIPMWEESLKEKYTHFAIVTRRPLQTFPSRSSWTTILHRELNASRTFSRSLWTYAPT